MTYFKVKATADQKARKDGSIYIENELLTASEMKYYGTPVSYVTPVEVNRNTTYYFFGARFSEEA